MTINTTTTTITPEDAKLLKENNIKVADAIRSHCAFIRRYNDEQLFKENERLKRNIEGLQSEIARLHALVDNKK